MKRIFTCLLLVIALVSSNFINVFGDTSSVSGNSYSTSQNEPHKNDTPKVFSITDTFDYRITAFNTDEILVSFNKVIEEVQSGSEITLSCDSSNVFIKSVAHNSTHRTSFILVLSTGLIPDKNYSLVIPGNTVHFKDGTTFKDEISINFKAEKLSAIPEKDFNLNKNKNYSFNISSKFNYFILHFNKKLKVDEIENIQFYKEDNLLPLKCIERNPKNDSLIIPYYSNTFIENNKYKIFIPKNTINFADGSKYTEDISIIFRAPKNDFYSDSQSLFHDATDDNLLLSNDNYTVNVNDKNKRFGLNFAKPVSKISTSNITLKSKEEKLHISGSYIEFNDAFLYYKNNLKPNTEYSVHIPKNSIIFKDGSKYEEDIDFNFALKNHLTGCSYCLDDYCERLTLKFPRDIRMSGGKKAIFTDSDGNIISSYRLISRKTYEHDSLVYKFAEPLLTGTYTVEIPANSLKYEDGQAIENTITLKFNVKNIYKH